MAVNYQRFCFPLFLLVLPFTTAFAQSSPSPKSARIEVTEPLTRALRHQLLTLPYYSVFDTIDFSLSGDTVILTGQVLRPTLRTHAEAAVKSLEGVGAVVNNIEILPRSTTDDELRRQVYRAIFEDPELATYAIQAVPPIHIIVKNGAVTLVGKVDTEQDLVRATKQVGKVIGVTSTQNLLVVRKIDIPTTVAK
ncbi:MAG: BON domain-containing protein [Candidatus Acidiferrum sp.]